MSVDEERSLSVEELRKRLYQSFKKKGVLDTVKTQLRNQLIAELQRESLPHTASDKSHSLSALASNSLVIDHLQRSGYEYTLSVFYPECGISKEKVISRKDILGLLRISPHSPVYKNLVTDIHSEQKGLLVNVLSELIDHRLQSHVRDADTQTSDTPDYRESIMRKMQVIDEEYEVLRLKGQRWESVEVKLAEYRKEMEEQAEEQLKSKIQHFREVEISQVRMEEREKCRQEMLEVRQQLERNYQMKSEALMNREKNAIERLQKQQQMEEKEIYNQRQTLLKEIQSVHNRETELTLRMEAFNKSCKLHEENMRSSAELLRKRELDVRKMEETYDLKLDSEIKKHQQELKEDYCRRTEALTENENRIKEETVMIQREAAVINAKKEEHERVIRELSRLQEELKSARGDACALVQENAILKEKLEATSDYTTVRKEHLELQATVRLLRRQLEENQEEKQRLREELNTPSPALLALQAELKRLEVARCLDQEDFQRQRQVFQDQLRQEVERCSQLNVQLMECEERTKWMSTHTEELKQQLRHTQQALENEVLRHPKPSLVDRSVLDLNPDADVYTEGYHDVLSDPGIATRVRRRSQTEGEGMIIEALNRIQELEKEAENLEEAYRRFRQKGVLSHIPFKGTSPPAPGTPVAFLRTIGAATNRGVPDDVYAETELNQYPPGHMTPPRVASPPIRRLSSTPVSASKTKTKPRGHPEHEVMFSGLSSQREVSPIPAATSEEYTHITPPSSPQLKSTARDNCSPPKLQIVSSSSQESSPQPDRISIQDLTEPQADFVYSLEQLEETHTHLEQHGVVQTAAGNKHQEEEQRRMKEEEERRMKEQEERRMKEEEERRMKEEEERRMKEEEERRMKEEEERRMKEEEERRMKEEEERRMKKEEERRMKEERRQREREEAQEKERRDPERLTQLQQEALHQGEEEEEEEGRGGWTENREQRTEVKTVEEAGDNQDPLHKYMMIVMEGRQREREQNQKTDESEHQSPESVLSDHNDNSVAAFSHDDADDDFW